MTLHNTRTTKTNTKTTIFSQIKKKPQTQINKQNLLNSRLKTQHNITALLEHILYKHTAQPYITCAQHHETQHKSRSIVSNTASVLGGSECDHIGLKG